MKKLLIIATLFVTIFAACKKDDPVNYADLIIGKWDETHLTIEYSPEISPKEDYVIPPGSHVVEFNSDGKIYVAEGQAAPSYDGNWTIQNKTLNYAQEVYSIVELTASKLVYTQETSYPNYKTISTYTYIKK